MEPPRRQKQAWGSFWGHVPIPTPAHGSGTAASGQWVVPSTPDAPAHRCPAPAPQSGPLPPADGHSHAATYCLRMWKGSPPVKNLAFTDDSKSLHCPIAAARSSFSICGMECHPPRWSVKTERIYLKPWALCLAQGKALSVDRCYVFSLD